MFNIDKVTPASSGLAMAIQQELTTPDPPIQQAKALLQNDNQRTVTNDTKSNR